LTFNQFLDIFAITKDDYLMAIRTAIDTRKVFLKREVNEVLINNCNPKIMKMHRANIDIQYILDPYVCCAYVVQYINKSDR
jgi:hypothetical protein